MDNLAFLSILVIAFGGFMYFFMDTLKALIKIFIVLIQGAIVTSVLCIYFLMNDRPVSNESPDLPEQKSEKPLSEGNHSPDILPDTVLNARVIRTSENLPVKINQSPRKKTKPAKERAGKDDLQARCNLLKK